MGNWTPEAKKAQAEAIRRWQPWKNSTGPKTEDGKSRCRLNAEKHGRYNAGDIARRREMRDILAAQQAFLKSVRQLLRLRKHLKTQERTIMMQALIAQGQDVVQRMDARLLQVSPAVQDRPFNREGAKTRSRAVFYAAGNKNAYGKRKFAAACGAAVFLFFPSRLCAFAINHSRHNISVLSPVSPV